MIATELLLLGFVASTQATPVSSASAPSTTDWLPLILPDDRIDWTGINMSAFHDPANWKLTADTTTEHVTSNQGRPVLSGPCDQGTCPDHNAAFDLVFTYSAVTLPGDPNCPECPPVTVFGANSDIRVNDCGQCQRKSVGTTLGTNPVGGCYDFKGCNRDQVICVDPGRIRAHRIWKDNGHKTCYHMKDEVLGGCGPVKERDVVYPLNETPCTW